MRWLTRVGLGVSMAALGVTPAAHGADATFYTATYVEVIPPSATEAAASLRHYRQASRADASALRVDVLQRIGRPSQFVILAAWTDQRAFEAHAAATAAKELRAKLGPLLASPNDERWHNGLSVGSGSGARPAGVVYTVTHVDVIPPRKDDGLALLKQVAEASRGDAGNVGFDVLQQTNRPNHFTVVDAWADRTAFDAHVMAAHTRLFREQLAPMNGALYDERLYAALD
jgi:quinol monooxygenase YgiN